MTTVLRFKRIIGKLFSGIGRSGYSRNYTPEEIENPENLPINIKISPLSIFTEDFKLLSKKLKTRVKDLISSIESGNLYENDPDDPDEYTHSRERANISGYKIFSKDIDNEHRLIYRIKGTRKGVINGIKTLSVNVKLIGCLGHDNDQEIKDRISGNMSMRNKNNRIKLFSKKRN